MIIGMDVHGVLNKFPERILPFLEALIKSRHKVVIISGPPKEHIIQEITKLGLIKGIHYHGVVSVVDYLKESNCSMWQDENGRWWAPETNWWSTKASICSLNNVDIHFDDSIEYKKDFDNTKTEFILFDRTLGRIKWEATKY
jgi:hypothetical protein